MADLASVAALDAGAPPRLPRSRHGAVLRSRCKHQLLISIGKERAEALVKDDKGKRACLWARVGRVSACTRWLGEAHVIALK